MSSRNCIPLSFIDVVQAVGFFTSAEVAERISEAVYGGKSFSWKLPVGAHIILPSILVFEIWAVIHDTLNFFIKKEPDF